MGLRSKRMEPLLILVLVLSVIVDYCAYSVQISPLGRTSVQINENIKPDHNGFRQQADSELSIHYESSKGKAPDWEKTFLQLPNEAYAYEYLAYYTSLPHPAGTPEDYQTAQYTLQKFKEFGLNNSQIVELDVLLTYPKKRSLRLLSPKSFTAKLKEDYYSVDPSTADARAIPTFNGYSPSGNVTGQVVYLNYASIEDFAALEALGVNVSGKIGIARYGQLFRGTKAMIAQEKGMIGLIIYSDPADDGYDQGTVFPNGPWRPKSGVQRGSVQFLSVCPGDPQRKACSNNPNWNYTDGIPSIPVQPISWGDALPILESLGGTIAPKNFQGGLNFTYNIGPGPAVVNLYSDIEFVVTKIWNVIATIEGVENDRSVLLGNHRDAWVFGATDPNSGTATMLEVARSFGVMLKQGWKPQRNIIFASWDGEEYGLLGSTGWIEANANTMDKTAIAYLNVDVAVTGPNFGLGCTPSLESVVRSAASQVIDPNSGKPLSQVWTGPAYPLGSGSDYTAFLDHFGIASIDMGFDGPYGVYHSIYDDLYWMKNFGDPDFLYHKACAQLWGLVALKLADSDVIPFNYTNYGVQLQQYLQATQQLLAKTNRTLDLTQLQNAIVAFQQAAKQVEKEMINPKDSSLNDRLIFTERQFLSELGLPGRPYYKHVIQAPGLYAGYAASTFPGLTQVIQETIWNQTLAQEQYNALFTSIGNAASFLAGNQHV